MKRSAAALFPSLTVPGVSLAKTVALRIKGAGNK